MKLYEAHIFGAGAHSGIGPFTSETVEDAVADVEMWGDEEGEVYYHTNSSAAKGYPTPQIPEIGFHTIYVRRVDSGMVIGKVTVKHE